MLSFPRKSTSERLSQWGRPLPHIHHSTQTEPGKQNPERRQSNLIFYMKYQYLCLLRAEPSNTTIIKVHKKWQSKGGRGVSPFSIPPPSPHPRDDAGKTQQHHFQHDGLKVVYAIKTKVCIRVCVCGCVFGVLHVAYLGP